MYSTASTMTPQSQLGSLGARNSNARKETSKGKEKQGTGVFCEKCLPIRELFCLTLCLKPMRKLDSRLPHDCRIRLHACKQVQSLTLAAVLWNHMDIIDTQKARSVGTE